MREKRSRIVASKIKPSEFTKLAEEADRKDSTVSAMIRDILLEHLEAIPQSGRGTS